MKCKKKSKIKILKSPMYLHYLKPVKVDTTAAPAQYIVGQ